MTLQQFLLILRARLWVVLLTFVFIVASTVGVSLWLPKRYTATASVVVDVKSPDPVSGLMLQGMVAPSYMATQVDIINSDRVAQRVVKLLKMEESESIRRQWEESSSEKGDLVDWLANLLQKYLEVRPARDSNVINIHYTGTDPRFAAAVANAFAQAYMDVNLELRVAPAKQYAAFFDEQTRAARDKLEEAQQALSNYQQAHGITSTDERLDFETAKLNETSSQLTGLQGLTTDSQSKRDSNQGDTLSEVMQNPVINGLKSDIARLEAKLTESNVNLGKNHPQTQRNEAELLTLRSQLDAEIRKVNRSIDTTYQVNRQREAQLRAALANQKARVLALNKQRDELNVLRRDIESAQRSFEQVSQRASQTHMESRTNQTNIAVLNPASVPVLASKPRVLINTLVSVFMGSLIGVGLALLMELSNRRVRCMEDLINIYP
ncbi:MAG: chain length determinant protein EpsF [Burkholderiales bacterium]